MDYSSLPKIDLVADEAERRLTALGEACARPLLIEAVRAAVAALRRGEAGAHPDRAALSARAVEDALARYRSALRPSLRPVVNATGVVLHTNLGRAPLAAEAVSAAVAAAGYCNLELELDSGSRGSRHDHVTALLRGLTGAEDAIVVNNNAAAVLLALDTLARGGEAVVSRGQLVEIGGSFRIPEVVACSHAILREVGSTNKTHPADYESAIGPATACILQVHPSNFRMEGFVASVPTRQLSALAHRHGLPLLYDLGSGCLHPFATEGIGAEPLPAKVIADGADVITFSGDKLLGGPQAGILAGGRRYLEQIRQNPLLRALRVDKLTLAALEATLSLYRAGRGGDIPAVAMITATPDALRKKAETLLAALTHCPAPVALAERSAPVGGGALPEVCLPGWVVELSPPGVGADEVLRRLRTGTPAVLAYIHQGRVCFDPRTIPDADLLSTAQAILDALL